MAELVIKRTIEVPTLKAQDWDLFCYEGLEEDRRQRSERAAVRLNEAFAEGVNAGWDRNTVFTFVEQTMVQFSDIGAYDTEPRYVLEDLLDKVFGKE